MLGNQTVHQSKALTKLILEIQVLTFLIPPDGAIARIRFSIFHMWYLPDLTKKGILLILANLCFRFFEKDYCFIWRL